MAGERRGGQAGPGGLTRGRHEGQGGHQRGTGRQAWPYPPAAGGRGAGRGRGEAPPGPSPLPRAAAVGRARALRRRVGGRHLRPAGQVGGGGGGAEGGKGGRARRHFPPAPAPRRFLGPVGRLFPPALFRGAPRRGAAPRPWPSRPVPPPPCASSRTLRPGGPAAGREKAGQPGRGPPEGLASFRAGSRGAGRGGASVQLPRTHPSLCFYLQTGSGVLREGFRSCCKSRLASEIACKGLAGERKLQTALLTSVSWVAVCPSVSWLCHVCH